MLCGDEIKSAVVDLGSSSCRFGTAGQDMPRHVFRSDIGTITDGSETRSIYGDNGLRYLHKDMRVHSLSQSSETKWEDIEHILTYGIESCMRLQTNDTPLFLADNSLLSGGHHDSKSSMHGKEKTLETCFEKVGSPAVYIASGAMLSAFSMGRTTCLVIDVGANGTKITPVVEGYELKKSSVYTTRGGNALDDLLHHEIVAKTGTPLKPWFECSEQLRTQCPNVTPSFRNVHIRDVVRDVKQWMCFVPHNPIICAADITDPAAVSRFREEELGRRGLQFPPAYELPDGTKLSAGDGVCTVPEKLFFASQSDPAASRKRTRDLLDSTFISDDHYAAGGNASSSNSDAMQVCDAQNGTVFRSTSSGLDNSLMGKLQHRAQTESLTDLVYAAVAHADVDVRKELLANIHIVGGGSLLSGLSNRLTFELNNVVPTHLKVKLVNALPIERHHAAWVGGSILGICGSFQQLWLSKGDYEELGAHRAALKFDH